MSVVDQPIVILISGSGSNMAALVEASLRGRWRERFGEDVAPSPITPRQVLVHTLAHALMRQLTLDCGYSSTALRERLYVDQGEAKLTQALHAEEYHSHNTQRLDVEGMKRLLLKLDFMKAIQRGEYAVPEE